MFSRISLLAAVLLAAALLLLSAGCSPGTVDQEYIDFADTAAEQYLISINEKDFESFSEHLGTEMKEALPEQEFIEFADQLEQAIGHYKEGSKEYLEAEKQSGYIGVNYNTQYTEEPGTVAFRLVLEKVDGQIVIADSWFDSPKLREELQ